MSRRDEELERLRAAVSCATVLERLATGWTLDKGESTRRALKYRGGPGEIVIVNHDGRGWWDPHRLPSEAGARGDVFSLVQRLDPRLNFGQVRKALQNLAGITPTFLAATKPRQRTAEVQPPALRWSAQRRLRRGSQSWRYLMEERKIPTGMLATAACLDVVRQGPYGSAWFAHRANDGRLTGIEVRGPRYRGFTAHGTKSLFRLPGSGGVVTRLVVLEAPIDALSFAAFERIRANTLYVATGGGMGPGTVAALEGLLVGLATSAHGRVVVATDADEAGERYAKQLAEMATKLCLPVERARPPNGMKDWNDAIKARAGRVVRWSRPVSLAPAT